MEETMYIVISVIVIALLVITDRVIKDWAVEFLIEKGSIPFLSIGATRAVDLTYVENDGAVFGSFGGKTIILIIVTTLLILFCAGYLIRDKAKSKLLFVSLNLIIAGGIGNWIDRVFNNGLVIDYIEIKLFNFAVFNFADICVTVGVALVLIYAIFFESKSKKEKSIGEKENAA